MRSFLKYSVACFAISAALVSCNKESDNYESSVQNEGVTLLFSSQKPELENATKTVWRPDERKIFWSSSDKIRVAILKDDVWQQAAGDVDIENRKYAKLYTSNQAGTEAEIIDFAVPTDFTMSDTGTYKFYGIYPSSCTNTDANAYMPSLTVTIPSTQEPASSGSFDSSADIMVAESVGDYSGIPQDRMVRLEWTRLVAHGDITLKNFPALESGEILRKISFSAQSDADLVGRHYVDLTTGAVTLPAGADPVSTITIDASNLNVDTANNTLEFWFSALPFTATQISVSVTTNKYIYTKTYSGISKTFIKNARNTLGISLANATKEDAPEEQLVEDGIYVIALMGETNLDADLMMTANTTGTGNYQTYSTLGTTYVDGKLSVPAASVWKFTYDAENATYSIQSLSEEKYLAGTAASANLTLGPETNKAAFTVSEQSKDGNNNQLYHISVKSTSDERWIGFNYNNGTLPRFSLYKNDTSYPGAVRVIPAVANDIVPSLVFNSTSSTVASSATSASFSYTASHLTANPTVSITSDPDDIVASATVDASNNKVVVSLNPNNDATEKTATLTISCEGIEDIELTVTQNAKSNLVEDVLNRALTEVTGTSYTGWSGKTSNSTAVYAGNSAGDHDSIQLRSNNNNSGIVTTSSGGYVATITVTWESNTVSGRTLNIYGKNSAYSSAADLYDTSKQGILLGTIVCGTSTTFTVTGDYQYIGLRSNSGAMYLSEIRISWRTASASSVVSTPEISLSGSNVSLSTSTSGASIYYTLDGSTPSSSSMLYSSAFSISSLSAPVTVKAIAAKSGMDDSDVASAIFYKVNVGTPVGGTISADRTWAEEGDEITLTKAPSTGYSFSAWNVTNISTSTSITVASDKFTMPSGNVNVNATFTESGGGTPTEYTIQWGASYNSSSVSGYTASWDATKDGFKVNMANFNNNNNGWSYVKCGRKNNASVATIITDKAITEAIKTVTITIDALTADKINSIKLYVSSSKTSGWTSVGTFTKATGNQSVTIASPAANKFYKLEFDCASGSSNGLLTLSKAVFSTN